MALFHRSCGRKFERTPTMTIKITSTLALATTLFASAAMAQTTAPVSTSPAPQIAAVSATPAPNQTIYASRLPSATELSNVAAAQGVSIEKIDQTNSQVTVVYRTSNGQTNTIAYLLLPAGGAPAYAAPTSPPPT